MIAMLAQLSDRFPAPHTTMEYPGSGSFVAIIDATSTGWVAVDEYGHGATYSFADLHVRGPMPAEWRTNELAKLYYLPKYYEVMR